jgi:hypothetical protein
MDIKKYSYEANGITFDLDQKLYMTNLPPMEIPYVLVRFSVSDRLIGTIKVVIQYYKFLNITKSINDSNQESYIYDRCYEQCKEKQCGERLLALNNPNIILLDETFEF